MKSLVTAAIVTTLLSVAVSGCADRTPDVDTAPGPAVAGVTTPSQSPVATIAAPSSSTPPHDPPPPKDASSPSPAATDGDAELSDAALAALGVNELGRVATSQESTSSA